MIRPPQHPIPRKRPTPDHPPDTCPCYFVTWLLCNSRRRQKRAKTTNHHHTPTTPCLPTKRAQNFLRSRSARAHLDGPAGIRGDRIPRPRGGVHRSHRDRFVDPDANATPAGPVRDTGEHVNRNADRQRSHRPRPRQSTGAPPLAVGDRHEGAMLSRGAAAGKHAVYRVPRRLRWGTDTRTSRTTCSLVPKP